MERTDGNGVDFDTAEKIIVAVEDEWGLWPLVKQSFETRLPLKRAALHNKARRIVEIDRLPLDYILTTDPKLRSRPPAQNSPHWFRHPYATIILVCCEDADEYRTIVRPRIQLLVKNEWREWIILHISKTPQTETSSKLAKRVFNRMEDHFRKDRCCKLDIFSQDIAGWIEVEQKIVESIRTTLDMRVMHYDAEIRRLSEKRYSSGWNFCSFFVDKESLALMLEMAQLREDALQEYDELEQLYLELVKAPYTKLKEFGGNDVDDSRAAILEHDRKPFSGFAHQETLKQFDFRQYIFARQAALLFALGRPGEVAERGLDFIYAFSKELSVRERSLPFCLREVWVFTACSTLARVCTEQYVTRYGPMVEKDFFRIMGDLYSYARAKLMRLADLTGNGGAILQTPCNSAALSMSPWPHPAEWPGLPQNSSDRIRIKEVALQEEMTAFSKSLGHHRELALAPVHLLHEANRRRASRKSAIKKDLWHDKSPSLGQGQLRYSSPPPRLNTQKTNEENPHSAPTSPQGSPSANLPSSPSFSEALGSPPGSQAAETMSPFPRTLSLPEIQVAAEAALNEMVTDRSLKRALLSPKDFEELYVELTRRGADSYQKAGRRRQCLGLEYAIAGVHLQQKKFDAAARLFEKLCGHYGGEQWNWLLMEVLPRLSQCQVALGNWAGHLSTAVKVLSLERDLVPPPERQRLQQELVQLAHGGLEGQVSLDMLSLLTFSASCTPPLELCEGHSTNMSVMVWSGLPDNMTLDSISLTLVCPPNFSADEGIKAKADKPSVLRPGKNSISMHLTALKQGSYVPAVMTAVLGSVRLRSSSISVRGGPPEADDYLSMERPFRPVLKVTQGNHLVEMSAAVTWGLLAGEPQWAGLLIQPVKYSLQGTRLHVSPGPGLTIEQPQMAEIELYSPPASETSLDGNERHLAGGTEPQDTSSTRRARVGIEDGIITLPDWAARLPSLIWIRVMSQREHEDFAEEASTSTPTPFTPAPTSQTPPPPVQGSAPIPKAETPGSSRGRLKEGQLEEPSVEGRRFLMAKLEYGTGGNRMQSRSINFHFTEPFSVSVRVISRFSDGILLLQVILRSLLLATIDVVDAELALQPGYTFMDGQAQGSSDCAELLPLTVASGAEGAIMYSLQMDPAAVTKAGEDTEGLDNGGSAAAPLSSKRPGTLQIPGSPSASVLQIKYKVDGNRMIGAHAPVGLDGNKEERVCGFKYSFVLQAPVAERHLGVGMTPLAPLPLRVGEMVTLQWTIERLLEAAPSHPAQDDEGERLEFLVKVNSEHWMIAGRKKGFVTLPHSRGSRITLSIACVPIVAGHMHPPTLRLPRVDRGRISHMPAAPHLVCVFPPEPCSSFCISKQV